VDTDLVLPASFELDLQEGCSGEAFPHRPASQRRLVGLVPPGDGTTPADPGIAERGVDDALLGPGRPGDDRKVASLDPMSAEHLDESGTGLSRQRNCQGPARVPIEAVHPLHEPLPRPKVGHVLPHPAEDGVLLAIARARGHLEQPGRLVHDQYVPVLVQDGQRAAGSTEARAVRIPGDLCPRCHLVARFAHPHPVDAHLALLDGRPRLPAGECRVQADQSKVETHPGFRYSLRPRASSHAAGSWPK